MNEASNIFWAAFGGGAAAGAVIGVIELFRWLGSRPLLKVEVELGEIVGTIPYLYFRTGELKQASCVFLEARNPHLAPVTVSSFGFDYKRPEGERMTMLPQIGYEFPYEVAGGKELTQWTTVSGLLDKLRDSGRRPSDLKWAWFKASSGKEFRGRISPKIIAALDKAFEIADHR